jgi:hypothetical protein
VEGSRHTKGKIIFSRAFHLNDNDDDEDDDNDNDDDDNEGAINAFGAHLSFLRFSHSIVIIVICIVGIIINGKKFINKKKYDERILKASSTVHPHAVYSIVYKSIEKGKARKLTDMIL